MQLKILLSYLLGYVDVEIEGYYIERFMNLCASQNIMLWKLSYINKTILHARLIKKDFKRLRSICRKTGCVIKIKKKNGIPFILNKYKKRKIFVAFLVIVFFLTISLSGFIWNIEIIGNETILSNDILKIVNECGLNIGTWKKSINTKKIINDLRIKRDDIAWVGIEQKGTNVIIKIVEADKKPDIINEEEFCNIISDKDAMILKISAANGTPLVKEGDVVKKGDLLIGGWMDGKYTDRRYLHAQGEVQAKVWYTNKQRVELIEMKKEETGNCEIGYSVNINKFKINFYKRLSKFKNYDTIEENKKLSIFSNFYLPIEIIKRTNNEYKNVQIVHTIEEAKQIGVQRAEEILKKQIENNENILNEQINTYDNATYVEVEVTYEVQENIGTKEKIVF